MMNASGCKTRYASTQIARRAVIFALWQIQPVCAGTKREVTEMLRRVNGRPIPNKGYIKISDIEKALRGEYKLVNSAE